MQIPDEIRDDIEFLDTWIGREPGGSLAWKAYARFRDWFNAQPQGEWVPVEGESTIECGCDDDRCTAELHIDSLDGMAISIEDGDYTSTIYLPYDVRLCRKTEANRE